ncbi:MAG: RNA polymerase sigma factor [Candidatus Woesebacteria bacterium GW2011_GWA2_40_7]|uniref:RNA polymerase sigma factor n=3 Tax=Candidatus Woeseibacteriota TaxID=1752722 RepID=A0A0G0XWY5_9BACT|nr:MAG: RNA polymerase sigma factor [Candidatus Woesebacteria bacterium GW2011_GWB1_39_10]KKR73386.1 MAG: RNA polymerase sigma factor [Candidatus Woesebacteria bacterium GW2011_GWA2_40_7]KKR92427.1 MAG: RNA polymerase sigma factor [Candidatus Woesebacteria bacterium GW2011_GWA1_41_13b]
MANTTHFDSQSSLSASTFEAVFEKLAIPLTKFVIKRVSGDSEAVEEVLSSTMVAAWRGWNSFRHKSSYFTWMCRIALNKIADYYHDQVNRNSKIIVPLIDAFNNVDSKSLSPEETLALNDLRKSVNDCLNLLPPEKRRLLQFRYWYDLSYSEISKIVGISERAVEGQLYRARHEFAEVWSRESKD